MSHPARLALRAPPHLPFVQGWPGIPSSPDRPPAAVHGTVELRIGPQPLKARWVRAEVRRYETPPPGFPSAQETWELVGEISTLWQTPPGKDWDDLQQGDFKFYIPLPSVLPPTVEMMKNTGVRYELVAALCYRQKGGVFKKESAPILKISEPLRITTHQLHSAWPIYNVPDTHVVADSKNDVILTVHRPSAAFGPTDRILFTATLESHRQSKLKLKGFECHLNEVVTVTPVPQDASNKSKKKPAGKPTTKSRMMASARGPVDETILPGKDISARLDMPVPADKLLVTTRHARSISVEYELEVKAVCNGGIPDIVLKGIPYTVGPFPRAHAQQAVRDIGRVESLSPARPVSQVPPSNTADPLQPLAPTQAPSPAPRPRKDTDPTPPLPPGARPLSVLPPLLPIALAPGQPAVSHPVQGFIPQEHYRRKSSDTSSLTTTTATVTTLEQGGPTSRQPSAKIRPGSVAFPTANPSGGRDALWTAPSTPTPSDGHADDSQQSQSDAGHGTARFSTLTFGQWDNAATISAPASPSLFGSNTQPTPTTPGSPAVGAKLSPDSAPRSRQVPSSWLTSGQEKKRLYDEARARAAAAQQSAGIPLDMIGLQDSQPTAPPEYAPRRPERPGKEYTAPRRPVSLYASSSERLLHATGQSHRHSGELDEARDDKKLEQQVYLSAAEEKELQRKRFEEASQRVASGAFASKTAGSSSAAPEPDSASSTPAQDSSRVSAVVMPSSALGEKEQMRRYYEAQDGVAKAKGPASPGSSSDHGQASGSGSAAAGVGLGVGLGIGGAATSVLGEKEQMKRYYEAQDRVAQAAAASTDRNALASGSGPPASGVIASSAISEKEQMRRYYEAQDRVAQAGAGSPRIIQPSTASAAAPPPFAPSPSPVSLSAGVTSAVSEKEQMRRYYEAQDRVAQAAQNGSPVITADPIVASGSGSADQAPPPLTGADLVSSALSEKEQMRRYYEAQDRVSRTAGGTGPGGPSLGPASTDAPPYTPAPMPSSAAAGPSTSSSTSARGNGATFPSAAEEKEQMKKRFEAAQAAVERSRQGQGQGQSFSSSSARVPAPNKTSVQPLVGGQVVAADSGPPPPLPTKPPIDYINLLSPLRQSSGSHSIRDSIVGVAGGASGSASGSHSGVNENAASPGVLETTGNKEKED